MTADERRGWRVGHEGRDRMFYEELHHGNWDRIELDGEMLMGRAHHVIYFASPERWQTYPLWARGRRDEIIARITSELREPDYEYHGLSGTTGSASGPPSRVADSVVTPAPKAATRRVSPPAERRALLGALLVLFAVAGLMAWLVARGVTRGETYLPLKQATLRRSVSRETEPMTFWLSVGIYATIGAGALTLGALGVRATQKT